MKKQKVLIIGICILVFVAIPLSYSNAKDKNEIWSQEPTIVYKGMPEIMKDNDNGEKMYSGDPPTRIAWDAILEKMETKEGNLIKKNYATAWVNPNNNTIFMAMKEITPKLEAQINQIASDLKITVILKQGKASYQELQSWSSKISEMAPTLKENDVEITRILELKDGTLGVEVIKLTEEKVEKILSMLENVVPPGILLIYNIESFTIKGRAAQDADNDPLVAGIKVTSYHEHATTPQWSWSTTNFVVEWGGHEGFLIAGHCASDNTTSDRDHVFQPTSSAGYFVGETAIFDEDQDDADCALIEFDPSDDGDEEIWKTSSTTYTVYGERTYAQQLKGHYTCFMAMTGFHDLEILDKGRLQQWVAPFGGGLDNVIYCEEDDSTSLAGGDSGAPAFIRYWDNEAEEWMAYACGIYIGTVDIDHGEPVGIITYELYCPCDQIEAAVGENLDFNFFS